MGFSRYILRRAFYAALVLLFILSFNFVIFRLMPGDPVSSILDPRFTPEAKMELKHQFGLDKPPVVQYVLYMRNLLRFDLGYSFSTRMPVSQEIMQRLPNTVLLLGVALALTMIFGVILGVFASSRRGSSTASMRR